MNKLGGKCNQAQSTQYKIQWQQTKGNMVLVNLHCTLNHPLTQTSGPWQPSEGYHHPGELLKPW